MVNISAFFVDCEVVLVCLLFNIASSNTPIYDGGLDLSGLDNSVIYIIRSTASGYVDPPSATSAPDPLRRLLRPT